ncbi:MAG: hypothetical protein GWO81_02965 [Verrucomicrobia bacterium]|nr:hypothetical protein [Verrucomicrobiota bacterium]
MKYFSKKWILLILALGIGAPVVQAEDSLPSVYDLYREFLAQNGGQNNLDKLNSVILSGHIIQDDQKLNFRLYRKRPNKMRIAVKVENLEISTIFDGEQAWRQVSNDSDVVALDRMKGEELASAKKDSNFDSPFLASFEKRKFITVAGIEDINGKEAVRLDFDPKGNFGFKSIWLSLDHYQEVKILRSRYSDGSEASDEAIHYEGFYRLKGVYWARSMRHFVGGELTKEVVIEDVLLNAGVFDYYFEVDEAKILDAQ